MNKFMFWFWAILAIIHFLFYAYWLKHDDKVNGIIELIWFGISMIMARLWFFGGG